MARTLRRLAHRTSADQGSALVLTMAVILLTGLMATVLLATTVFTTSHTTSTRANVQAVAAAEAGADAAARSIMNGTCYSPMVNPGGSPVTYSVQVWYQPAGSDTWVGGCPPSDADGLRLLSTGTAEDAATGGNTRGNTAQVEMLLERPDPTPRFNKAIFGDLVMQLNTSLSVTTTSPGDTADLYTNGDFTCSTHLTVAGSVYVQGNALLSSSPCTISGDMYVSGNMQCPAGTTIGGDLYVQGVLTMTGGAGNPCRVDGNVWSGGNASNSTGGGAVIGGDFTVRGNFSLTGLPVVSGQTRIRGTLGPDAWWRDQYLAAYPGTTYNDAGVGYPPTIPVSPDNVYPQLTKTDPLWSGFTTANWRTTIEGLRTQTWIDPCASWGLVNPLVVNANTVFDTTIAGQCPSGLTIGGGFSFVLNADAVIFVTSFNQGGNSITVTSGDGNEHSLYIIQPWPAGQTTCPASGGSPNITLSSGSWTQDNLTRVMFYSPREIDIKTNPAIRGQVYGCTVRAQTGTSIAYAPVGAVVTTPDLTALTLQHIRDVID